MSMHTACTAMLRFSPKLSTFSCVFACARDNPDLKVAAFIRFRHLSERIHAYSITAEHAKLHNSLL